MPYKQHTVVDDVSCTGIGLHSGKKVKLTIKPAPPDSGIRFHRKDLSGYRSIRANWKNVVDTNMSTTIGLNGCKVSTIEHLMAAFFGLGIDNARVEIDGPEIPIMDGSSAPFIFLIKSVGIKEQKKSKQFIIIKKPIKINDGNRSINIYPSKELKISFTIDFYHPLLRNQKYDLRFSAKEFINEISRARTFGFLNDIKSLRQAGLAMGGSLDNAIVIDDFRILNEDGLRYKNEFVRHKILDFIGDLAVVGIPIIGKFEIQKSGHSLNHSMIKKLMANKKCWEKIIPEEEKEDLLNSIKVPVFGPLEQIPISA
ncbi:MAG: UDP-3-O-acyl-N-acetylglucosamine deacetylase [Deltaproteobacteria bacterium]|nr:UDP-3-O-acyl-N-acetylglucosamine deacetylase [Deltaproteobacteria bacterium]